MLILTEQKNLKERGTEYRKISAKDAWNVIVNWVKAGHKFQAHMAFFGGCVTCMEGHYDKTKFRGSSISFSDTRDPFHNFNLYVSDIIGAEYGEDAGVGFETVRVDLRSKSFVSITPTTY